MKNKNEKKQQAGTPGIWNMIAGPENSPRPEISQDESDRQLPRIFTEHFGADDGARYLRRGLTFAAAWAEHSRLKKQIGGHSWPGGKNAG